MSKDGIDLILGAYATGSMLNSMYEQGKKDGTLKNAGSIFTADEKGNLKSVQYEGKYYAFNSAGSMTECIYKDDKQKLLYQITSEITDSSATYFADENGDGKIDSKIYLKHDDEYRPLEEYHDFDNDGNYDEKTFDKYDKDGNLTYEKNTEDKDDNGTDDYITEAWLDKAGRTTKIKFENHFNDTTKSRLAHPKLGKEPDYTATFEYRENGTKVMFYDKKSDGTIDSVTEYYKDGTNKTFSYKQYAKTHAI